MTAGPLPSESTPHGCNLQQLADAKRLPIEFLRELGLRDEQYYGTPAVAIPYRAADERETGLRYRIALTGDRFRWATGAHVSLYGRDRVAVMKPRGFAFLVEGESDCWTLWHHDLPAFGIPGAATWQDDWAADLEGIAVLFVVEEPDAGGATLKARLAGCPTVAPRVLRLDLSRWGVKDPSALYLLDSDPDRFRERLQEAMETAEPLPEPEPEPGHEEATAEIAWPAPIDDAAYHGLVGEIVREIEPTTEADPIALLLHLLAFFGNAAGLRPHVLVEDTEHGTNEFVALVGATSKARKGTAEQRIRRLFEAVDQVWIRRIKSGLSSGEGLIWNVRDAIVKDGKIEDKGEPDKRLLALESELATTLRRIEREGSSLSAILRDAFDRKVLDTLVSERSRPAARSSENHISVVGHITRSELRRYMSRTEMANGLGNRILWGLVKRSRYLPRGARPPGMASLAKRLHDALEYGRGAEEFDLDRDALRMWEAVYPALSDAKPGLAGEMVARGEAHVLRLALIYALLDQDTTIRPVHLLAALAVWSYCEESVFCIFGAELGDADADAVLALLQGAPKGLTTTELHNALDRNWVAARMASALKTLVEHGAVSEIPVATKGRPATRYQALAGSRSGRPTYLATARRVMREYEVNEVNEESPKRPSVSTNEPPAAALGTTKKLDDGPRAPEIVRRFFVDSSLSAEGDLNGAGPRSADSSFTSYPARASDDDQSEADASPTVGDGADPSLSTLGGTSQTARSAVPPPGLWQCPADRGSGHVQGTRPDGSMFCATCYGPRAASGAAAGELAGGQP